jgi:hypothetical protein
MMPQKVPRASGAYGSLRPSLSQQSLLYQQHRFDSFIWSHGVQRGIYNSARFCLRAMFEDRSKKALPVSPVFLNPETLHQYGDTAYLTGDHDAVKSAGKQWMNMEGHSRPKEVSKKILGLRVVVAAPLAGLGGGYWTARYLLKSDNDRSSTIPDIAQLTAGSNKSALRWKANAWSASDVVPWSAPE